MLTLWIVFKEAPIAIGRRDKITKKISCRLDKWFMPSIFRESFPNRVELLVAGPCLHSRCRVCNLSHELCKGRFDGVHYVTYAMSDCLFRSTKRHIQPPEAVKENAEAWFYYKIPMEEIQVWRTLVFLESQIGKPFHYGFHLNFICFCRRRGVKLDDDYSKTEAWSCSELAAATLVQFCPQYESFNCFDPCLVSPCMLESQLQELDGVVVQSFVEIRPYVFLGR